MVILVVESSILFLGYWFREEITAGFHAAMSNGLQFYGKEPSLSSVIDDIQSTVSEKIQTTSFIHYNDRKRANDKNGDKFLDKPIQDQLNLLSKWQYTDATNGIVSFLNIRYLDDNKKAMCPKNRI